MCITRELRISAKISFKVIFIENKLTKKPIIVKLKYNILNV